MGKIMKMKTILLFAATFASFAFGLKTMNITETAKLQAAGWTAENEEWGSKPAKKVSPQQNKTRNEALVGLLKGTMTGIDVVTEADFEKTECKMPKPAGYYSSI